MDGGEQLADAHGVAANLGGVGLRRGPCGEEFAMNFFSLVPADAPEGLAAHLAPGDGNAGGHVLPQVATKWILNQWRTGGNRRESAAGECEKVPDSIG